MSTTMILIRRSCRQGLKKGQNLDPRPSGSYPKPTRGPEAQFEACCCPAWASREPSLAYRERAKGRHKLRHAFWSRASSRCVKPFSRQHVRFSSYESQESTNMPIRRLRAPASFGELNIADIARTYLKVTFEAWHNKDLRFWTRASGFKDKLQGFLLFWALLTSHAVRSAIDF